LIWSADIIPYLGSILGLSVALPLAYLQPDGGLHLVGICVAVFAAVQLLEGWVLTPRIMGRQTGLHPVAIIVAVFFWGQALGGVLGMMLAVPLTAFFVTAWRFVRHKHSPPGNRSARHGALRWRVCGAHRKCRCQCRKSRRAFIA